MKTRWHNIPEDTILQYHCNKNLKSHLMLCIQSKQTYHKHLCWKQERFSLCRDMLVYAYNARLLYQQSSVHNHLHSMCSVFCRPLLASPTTYRNILNMGIYLFYIPVGISEYIVLNGNRIYV
jgi:hypothetical protein